MTDVEAMWMRVGCGPKTRHALEAALTQPLREENQRLRALLMTLMDIATEAASDRPTYDFKPRAESAAKQAQSLLGGKV